MLNNQEQIFPKFGRIEKRELQNLIGINVYLSLRQKRGTQRDNHSITKASGIYVFSHFKMIEYNNNI